MYATYRIAGVRVQASLRFPGWRFDDIRSICVVQNELDGAGSKAKNGVVHDSVCACESRHVPDPCYDERFVLRSTYLSNFSSIYLEIYQDKKNFTDRPGKREDTILPLN